MPAHPQTSTAAIVAAGRRLLEERGVDTLTMREVADAVGVRTPSLYKRVRNRSDLFRLGGDVEQAWDFGLSRILTAIRRPAAEASPGEGAGGPDG